MVFEGLIGGSVPFVAGLVMLLAFFIGMALMRLPFEFVALVSIPVIFGFIAYYIPAISPFLSIMIGFIFAFAMLKIVRR